MGRVKLEVTADASDAISQMTKLGQAIKTAMSGFDSKGIDTWSGSVAKAITSINDRFSDIQKKIESLNKTFETKVTYGGTESLTTFKENLKVVKEALTDFSKAFSTSMTFGANDSVIKFQANIQKADEALTAFKEKMRTRPGFGASSDIASVKDKLKNTTDSVATFNKALATKPVMGAAQELANFEAKLKEFSQNIGMHIAPIYITLNNVKDAMTGLSTVLNNVQQPTWVEPFKKSMGQVVSVLKAIAREYKAVKKEIEAPINAGGGGAARELKFTEAAAQSMSKGVRTFYRHIRQEFKETRQAATETSKAIRDAMAMIQGGGAGGAGGGSSADGGQRLGFGEQLWSRMRSNMYSYLTMWFGVAGAIRAANALLEHQNELLEKGREYNQAGYNALGELYFKAGDRGAEYQAAAERLATERKAPSLESAYSFMASAAMSGISPEEAEQIAPVFGANIASRSDQAALMQGISYIKKAYGDKYSAKQIMATLLTSNRNNPSNIGPTVNALANLVKTYSSLGIDLPDWVAMFTVGSETNKDARVGTIFRAIGNAVETKGLQAMAIGDVMAGKGVAGYEYYLDENTGAYKFKDEDLQKQFEKGEIPLTMEILTHWMAGKGREVLKDIGFNMRTWLGAKQLGEIGTNPEEYNRILAELEKIAGGDTSSVDDIVESVTSLLPVAVEQTKRAVEATIQIREHSRAALVDSVDSIRKIWAEKHPFLGTFSTYVGFPFAKGTYGADWMLIEAEEGLEEIIKSDKYTDAQKENAKNAFKVAAQAAIVEYGNRYGYDISTEEGIRKTVNKIKSDVGRQRGVSGLNTIQEILEGYDLAENAEIANLRSRNGATSVATPTAAVRAISAASGVKYTNKWEEEEIARKQAEKEAKQADKEAKQADRDAKRKDAEEKQARKNFLNSLPKAALSAPANAVIENALGVALTDTNADLQQMRDVALNSDISGRTGGNILGKAFYAYASDKTDAKADKEIVNQLVASLNEQGFSLVGMKDIAQAFAQEGMVEGSPGWTEGNAKKYEKFFTDIRDYLEAISKGTAEMATVRKFPKRSTPKSSKK